MILEPSLGLGDFDPIGTTKRGDTDRLSFLHFYLHPILFQSLLLLKP